MRLRLERIALLPWGDVIEDFLDPIGVSLDDFRDQMTGGWMFGYIEALKRVGIQTTLFCVSSRIPQTMHWTHRPTGAPICVLPEPRVHRQLRESKRHVRGIIPYLATPVRHLRRELARYQCQALLCQEYENARFDISVALGRLIGLPVFAVFQGGDYQSSRIERFVRPWSMHGCMGLIVGPRAERARLGRVYGKRIKRIAPIYNPLDASIWFPENREAARAALGISVDAKLVVWHGRIDIRQKGLDVLLAAWHRAQQLCPSKDSRRTDSRLWLIGSGPDNALLAEMIAAYPNSGICWHREYVLDRDMMRRYLSAADVYAFPSRHEGFAVAPLEAMACGLPVVAADTVGIRDVLPDGELSGGIVVPCEDTERLGGALRDLIDSPGKRRRLGESAMRRLTESFTLDAVGTQLRELLNSGDTRRPESSK